MKAKVSIWGRNPQTRAGGDCPSALLRGTRARCTFGTRQLAMQGRRISTHRRTLWLASSFALLLMLLSGVRPAVGHERAVEIFREVDGQFEIVVAALPENPKVGIVHFSVTPLEAATGAVVSDANVTLTVRRGPDRRPILARAVNTPAAPQYYDANITFATAGDWSMTVEVRSDELGEANVVWPLRVDEQRITPNSAGGYVLLGIVILLVGGSVHLWLSSRRARARRGPAS